MRRTFELKNNFPKIDIVSSSIVGGGVSLLLTFFNDAIEVMNKMNQKINNAIGNSDNKEFIRVFSSLKLTSNIKMFFIIFFVVFIFAVIVQYLDKFFNSMINTTTNYLNQREIKIIENILEDN